MAAKITQNCLIDLHLHFDGSILPSIAPRLLALEGKEPPSTAELEHALYIGDGVSSLNEYLDRFAFPLTLVQSAAQIEELVALLADELVARGFIYAELRFAPQSCTQGGLTQRQSIEAAVAGLARSSLEGALILCCMRGADNEAANLQTIELAYEYFDRGVCAVDLAGAEALFATREFAKPFARAKELGLPITLHAGEAAGPQSVWEALELGALRIGHGVSSVADPALMAELAARHIALECCPSSNIHTGIYKSYAEFPLRELLDAGVCVTINSDNMAVSGTDARAELQHLADTFGLSNADIRQLLLNAASVAFTSPEKRATLAERIMSAFGMEASA